MGAIAATGAGISVAGDDRVVYTFDTRTWRVKTRWNCPITHEPTALARSRLDDALCYVSSLDNALYCGEFDGLTSSEGQGRDVGTRVGAREHLSFRGDSRWVGFDTVLADGAAADAQQEVLLGVTEGGSVYAVANAQLLHDYL